jgi:fumarate reductase subunit D
MKKISEPFWWSLFGAGGVASAMFLPALLFLMGIGFPLGLLSSPGYDQVHALLEPVIARLLVLAIISLSMFHWAHRFRFTLEDGLQLKKFDSLISLFCYGTAIGVSLFTAYSLWNF